MQKFGMTLNLKEGEGVIEKYRAHHRAVWPDVISGLKTVGVTRMDIFLHERRLFMYMETTDGFDLERDFPRYMESPRAKEWDALMRTFQEPVQDAAPGEWWAAMEHVFDLNR